MWMDGAVWSCGSPCRPCCAGASPWCRRGARPVGGQTDRHPQERFGEVSRGCPEPEVPAEGLGAAGPGLAPGPGRCCRLPNSPAWLGGRCLFWWRPRPRPRAGGGAGCGRRRCTVVGAAAGSPRPVPAVPCPPGSCTGDGRSIAVPAARVGPWLGKGVPGVCPGCPASLTPSLPRQCCFWAFL